MEEFPQVNRTVGEVADHAIHSTLAQPFEVSGKRDWPPPRSAIVAASPLRGSEAHIPRADGMERLRDILARMMRTGWVRVGSGEWMRTGLLDTSNTVSPSSLLTTVESATEAVAREKILDGVRGDVGESQQRTKPNITTPSVGEVGGHV
jgi:hypothetical protein